MPKVSLILLDGWHLAFNLPKSAKHLKSVLNVTFSRRISWWVNVSAGADVLEGNVRLYEFETEHYN